MFDAMFDALHQSTPMSALHQTLHQTRHQMLHQIASDGCIRFETPCFNPGTPGRNRLNGQTLIGARMQEGDE